MQQRLMEANPNSFRKLVASFLEVCFLCFHPLLLCCAVLPAGVPDLLACSHNYRTNWHIFQALMYTVRLAAAAAAAAGRIQSACHLQHAAVTLPALHHFNSIIHHAGQWARVLGHVGGEPGAPAPAVHRRRGAVCKVQGLLCGCLAMAALPLLSITERRQRRRGVDSAAAA